MQIHLNSYGNVYNAIIYVNRLTLGWEAYEPIKITFAFLSYTKLKKTFFSFFFSKCVVYIS